MKDDKPDTSTSITPYILGAIAAVVLIFGLTWLAEGNDFFLAKVFAPREEALRRETFEQSKAYRQGLAQDLRKSQAEYLRATPEQKGALASIILHETADVDLGTLPPDLADFIRQLRQPQGAR